MRAAGRECTARAQHVRVKLRRLLLGLCLDLELVGDAHVTVVGQIGVIRAVLVHPQAGARLGLLLRLRLRLALGAVSAEALCVGGNGGEGGMGMAGTEPRQETGVDTKL